MTTQGTESRQTGRASSRLRSPIAKVLACLILLTSIEARSCGASASDYELIGIETFFIQGARLDWSHDGEWIAFDRKDANDPLHRFDLYRVRRDGTDEECLTCEHPDLPNRHIGNPEFHPGGRWLLFQAEAAQHAFSDKTAPGQGAYNDLYVIDLESPPPYEIHRLTWVRVGDPPGGSLHAHFSHDGERLLWGDLEDQAGCVGDWRLAVAEFDPETPELTDHHYYEPGEKKEWYEAQDWSLSDSTIYFSFAPLAMGDGQDDRTMDFGRLDLQTEVYSRLTQSGGIDGEAAEWDEHGKVSPLGDAVTFMSSAGYELDLESCDYVSWLQTDLWIMNQDGSQKARLTHYNEPGYPEYLQGASVCVSDHSWSPDGTMLATEIFYRAPFEGVMIDLLQFSHAGQTESIDPPVPATGRGVLRGSYPNPFNGRTRIAFELQKSVSVELALYAPDGRRVGTLLDRIVQAGRHETVWDVTQASFRDLPSGVYFCRLVADGSQETVRVSLTR